MMSASSPQKDLEILVFCSHGMTFAAPMADIAEICDPQDIRDEVVLPRISHWMPCLSGERLAGPGKVIITKREPPLVLLVDSVNDFLKLEFREIQPLPSLVVHRLSPPWIWGGAVINGEIVLLVDFGALPAPSGQQNTESCQIEGSGALLPPTCVHASPELSR